jgi:hypothetical protein
MTSSRRLLASVGIALAVLTSPAAALAQSGAPSASELETARTLYKEGKDLRAAGDLRGAIEKLRAAHALGQTPVTGIELARTYVLAGKLVEAREVSLGIAHLRVAADETEKSTDARAEAVTLAEALRPRIPTLAVKLRGRAPDDEVHVLIDGETVPDAALSEPQKVNPGKHEVRVRAGEGAAVREATVTAETPEGQAIAIAVDVPPPPAAPPPPPPPPEVKPDPSYRTPLIAKLSFGAATLAGGLGIYAGIEAVSYDNSLSSECDSYGNKQCTAGTKGASDLYSARTWATVSNVSFIIVGAGIVTGVIDMFVVESRHTRPETEAPATGVTVLPWVGLGTAGVHGDF